MDTTQTIHDVGFDAAWELDLFGGNRRALEGANARLHAAGIEAEGVRMRIVAEVVRTWFTAVGSGQEMRTQQAARSEEHTSELPSLMRISSAVFCLKNKSESDKQEKTPLSITETKLQH